MRQSILLVHGTKSISKSNTRGADIVGFRVTAVIAILEMGQRVCAWRAREGGGGLVDHPLEKSNHLEPVPLMGMS